MQQFTTLRKLSMQFMQLELWLYFYHPIALISCLWKNARVKNWIREIDAAWQFCQDPELMVEEAFLHVTDKEVKNYIHHAEYF